MYICKSVVDSVNYNMFVNKEEYKLDYIAAGFPIDIEHATADRKSITGTTYKSRVCFMKNMPKCSSKVLDICLDEKPYVGKVLRYIFKTIIHNDTNYGKNGILLDNATVAKNTGVNITNVSKAISRLKELDVIRPIKSIEAFKNRRNISSKVYIINHNVIFNGNIEKLEEDFKHQDRIKFIDNINNLIIKDDND